MQSGASKLSAALGNLFQSLYYARQHRLKHPFQLGFAQLRLLRAETIDVGECPKGQLCRYVSVFHIEEF